MTVDDFILKMADGIRAGTIKLEGGTASIGDIGPRVINVTTLDAEPISEPLSFTLQIDAIYSQVKPQKPVDKLN